ALSSKAAQEQVAKLNHAQVNIVFHNPMLDLIGKLKPVMPSTQLDSFFFRNSGAEAIEAAAKLARHTTKKQNLNGAIMEEQCRLLLKGQFTECASDH
ncbi:281_t:CDS:2, partial [Dentiscutata heterogama]